MGHVTVAPLVTSSATRVKTFNWVKATIVIASVSALALVFVLMLGFVMMYVVLDPRHTPSNAMLPTLQANDKFMNQRIDNKTYKFSRGEIVLFRPPGMINPPIPQVYVKRIVGMPGDVIEIRKDRPLIVNGREVAEPYIQELPRYSFGATVVPKDQFFVLGDNRNNSIDSHKFGCVPKSNIESVALFRFYPNYQNLREYVR